MEEAMSALRWVLAASLCTSPVLATAGIVHTTLTPAEASKVERALAAEQSALVAAIAGSLAEDPSVAMWQPAWESLCGSLADPEVRALVARHVVDQALRLSGEAVAAAGQRVDDTKKLQEAVRKEQGRVVGAADRLVNDPEADIFHRAPAFIPDRALARVAPSAGLGQLNRMDQLQDYMTELADAADSLVDMLSSAERTADMVRRRRTDLEGRLPEIGRALATCTAEVDQGNAAATR